MAEGREGVSDGGHKASVNTDRPVRRAPSGHIGPLAKGAQLLGKPKKCIIKWEDLLVKFVAYLDIALYSYTLF